jgi:hypothetical protein
MSKFTDPNPPSRKEEDFPKTNTMPEGWNGDALMAAYNPPTAAPTSSEATKPNGSGSQCSRRPAPEVDEELFTRRLDPFPKPNTIPNGWDTSEWYV